MQTEPAIAFVAEAQRAPGLEVRVNFGVFAGRDATSAEIDDLGRALVAEVGPVSILSEQRYELSETAEALVHQVRIEIPPERLPGDESDRSRLRAHLVDIAESWALECISHRHGAESDL